MSLASCSGMRRSRTLSHNPAIRIKAYNPMTFEEACSLRLPSGKTFGEATAADWAEATLSFRHEAEQIRSLTPTEFLENSETYLQLLARNQEYLAARQVIEQTISQLSCLH